MFIDSHEILLLPLLFGIYVFIIGLGHPIIFYERYDDKCLYANLSKYYMIKIPNNFNPSPNKDKLLKNFL